MKRKYLLFILAALIMVSIVGCGANKVLQNYEAELHSLENADLYYVISKKSELDAIICHEAASIFKVNDEWEFEEGSLDSHSKVFTLAGARTTVSVDVADGTVLSTSYELSRCSDTDALEIYNMIVDMYGEPNKSEYNKGAIDGLFEGIDSFTWLGENGVIGMVYSPHMKTITII